MERIQWRFEFLRNGIYASVKVLKTNASAAVSPDGQRCYTNFFSPHSRA